MRPVSRRSHLGLPGRPPRPRTYERTRNEAWLEQFPRWTHNFCEFMRERAQIPDFLHDDADVPAVYWYEACSLWERLHHYDWTVEHMYPWWRRKQHNTFQNAAAYAVYALGWCNKEELTGLPPWRIKQLAKKAEGVIDIGYPVTTP